MPLFSLIIPCHNPEKTIFKLFDSLTRQCVPKKELEIIVVDDNSTSTDYWTQLKALYGLWNLVFVKTDTKVHCPGNTRREGMKYVRGEWLFFCDQDDYFEDNALAKVKEYIETRDKKMYVISTIMRTCDPVTDECKEVLAHKQAWLHGKWYSMKNLIIPYNVNFKKDLVTHEDIYFNSCVLNVLFYLETDWEYFDIYTYRWVDNPDSLTRRTRDDRGYLYENFQDYIDSASEPYIENAKEIGEPIFINQLIMTALHCYFYYEAASYYEGATKYADIIEMIRRYVWRLHDELNYSPEFIVDYVYASASRYDAVRRDCMIASGLFIPKTSFRDFIFRLMSAQS